MRGDMRTDEEAVAARHLLPAEMLAGLVSVGLGVSAIVGMNPVWIALSGMKLSLGIQQYQWWGIALVFAGALSAFVSSNEWFRGRSWKSERLLIAAYIRCGLACVLAIALLSLLTALLLSQYASKLLGLHMILIVMAVFQLWAVFSSRRLSACLNRGIRTPGLAHEIRSSLL